MIPNIEEIITHLLLCNFGYHHTSLRDRDNFYRPAAVMIPNALFRAIDLLCDLFLISAASSEWQQSPASKHSWAQQLITLPTNNSVYTFWTEILFQADDGFLEAILSFVVSVPMADVWQDASWRENQRKLLTAQFGPKEVETLSMNDTILDTSTVSGRSTPLEWMQSKELRELQACTFTQINKSCNALIFDMWYDMNSMPSATLTNGQSCSHKTESCSNDDICVTTTPHF